MVNGVVTWDKVDFGVDEAYYRCTLTSSAESGVDSLWQAACVSKNQGYGSRRFLQLYIE